MQLNRKKKYLEPGNPGDPFMLKPEITTFPGLPQIEKICMTAASVMGIDTPPHSLMTAGGTTTAFVSRHPQAPQKPKDPPMTYKSIREILGREHKYTGDMSDIGLKIRALSEFPGLDVQLFFETVLFSFIIGHNDLHLESFAIQIDEQGVRRLAPVWDIVSARFYMPEIDDFAMPMIGKTIGIKGKDFMNFSQYLKIHEKAYARLFLRFYKGKRVIGRLIKESALSTEEKIKFSDIVNERYKRLFS